MPLVIPETFINIHFGAAAEGDDELAYTSLGFELLPALDIAETLAIAQAINDAWQLSMKGPTSQKWAWTGSKVTLGSGAPPYLTFDLTGTATGEGFDSALPNNCALLVSKQTAVAGRPGRGRMYVPGLDGGVAFVSGRMAPTSRVDWQEAITEFMGLALLVEFVEGAVLFHDVTSPITAPSTIIGMTVSQQIATQRRRMRP